MSKIINIRDKKLEKKKKHHDLTFNHQNYINQIYLDQNFPEKDTILKELKRKLSSYLAQDKKKNRIYDKAKYINIEDLLPLLVSSKLRCHYCKKELLLLYNNKRDPRQWTLDRVDNNKPHNTNNVVVACLKCNLERRCRDNKKFLMSKQMTIIKCD
tara:strand:- start:10 stop:477 length:468 start_codon:yes stop_codon:yes gene_type:complete